VTTITMMTMTMIYRELPLSRLQWVRRYFDYMECRYFRLQCAQIFRLQGVQQIFRLHCAQIFRLQCAQIFSITVCADISITRSADISITLCADISITASPTPYTAPTKNAAPSYTAPIHLHCTDPLTLHRRCTA
jgi:hypothetical protein